MNIKALLMLLLLSVLHPGWAEPLDVSDITGAAHPPVEFCRTSAGAVVEEIDRGDCLRLSLKDSQSNPGFDRDAYWLKLDLFNPGSEHLERWVSTGHPRLAEISFFSPTPEGWHRGDVGNLTPRAVRGEVERQFGVFPVTLQPGERHPIWIRVHSDTAVNLMTRVWRPIDFLHDYQQRLFWSVLAQGGVLIAILFSLLMFGLTRQIPYLFFSIGLTGVLFNVSLSLGVLQRFIWPDQWPLPSQVIAASALVALLGFYGFTQTFLPEPANQKALERLFKTSLLMSAGILFYGVAIDYFAAAQFWGYFVALTVMLAFAKTYRAWRLGFAGAQFLALSFIIYLSMTLLRLLSISHGSWYPSAAITASWGIVITTPMILLGLLDRTRQLTAELAEAQSNNLRQLHFLAGMSHELRTPLDTILGHTQLLARRPQPPDTREGLSIIFQTARHLLHLIEHILDFSRGQAGVVRIKPHPVRLSAFFRSVEGNARLLARREHNQFALHLHGDFLQKPGASVFLDSDALRQILDNLIANAARHTQDGLITLSVTAHPGTPDLLRLDFEVADTGEGIEPGNLERIFSPFERAFSNTRDDKGLGLGLAISRQLSRLMGGELAATSKPGQGSRFRFSIVTKSLECSTQSDTEPDSTLGVNGYGGPRKSVLIVDDEADNRNVLVGLLLELGFVVSSADCGDQAIKTARNLTELDLVITDQFMARGDGWSVLEGLSEDWPDVPVFLVSGGPPSPPVSWPAHLQFAAHFLRPLDHDRLLQLIGDTLDLHWIYSPPPRPGEINGDRRWQSANADSAGVRKKFPIPEETELGHLASLVDSGQISAIKQWATSLTHHDPRLAHFSDAVMIAADRLDLDTLRILSKGGQG